MADLKQVRTSEGPYAMWVIMAGLAAMTAVTLGALFRYTDPSAIVTALGPVTGVIGTLVGAYFGLRGSSLAQQHAHQAEVARAQAGATPTGPPSSNGHGDVGALPRTQPPPDGASSATTEQQRLAELAAIDAPSDPDDEDLDLPDPDDIALDTTPEDEGDDREAHGAVK